MQLFHALHPRRNRPPALVNIAQAAIKTEASLKSQTATSSRRDGDFDGAGPEILLRIVALQPGADGVAIWARPLQQVDAGLRQLGPGLDLRQQRMREHQRLADPIGLVDDAQAVGIAVGYEDSEGERGDQNMFQRNAKSLG